MIRRHAYQSCGEGWAVCVRSALLHDETSGGTAAERPAGVMGDIDCPGSAGNSPEMRKHTVFWCFII